MSLPLATTTVTIRRPDTSGTVERYDTQSLLVVAQGVRAHIGQPSGRVGFAEGQSVGQSALSCDPCELKPGDEVLDDQTAQTYTVAWVRPRVGLGLNHMEAGLNHVAAA